MLYNGVNNDECMDDLEHSVFDNRALKDAKIEVTRQEICRERWRSAIFFVLRGLKSRNSNAGKLSELQIVSNVERNIINTTQALSIIINSEPSKSDKQKGMNILLDNIIAKIISFLRKPIFYRSLEENQALDSALKTLPAFSRFSKGLRMKIIEKGFMLDLEPYRVVIRQGGVK